MENRESNPPGLSEVSNADKHENKNDDSIQFDDLEWKPSSRIAQFLNVVHTNIRSESEKWGRHIRFLLICTLATAYNAYLIGAIVHSVGNDNVPIDWCDGVGFLVIITAIVYWSLFYYHVLKKYWGKSLGENVVAPAAKVLDSIWKYTLVRAMFSLIILGGILTFLVLDTTTNRRRLVSAAGVPIILLCALLISKHPARVVWRHILWGVAIQFLFGLMILRWKFGNDVVQCLSSKFERFLGFTMNGAEFVYGFTATGFTIDGVAVGTGGTVAFGVLPVIFYLSLIVAMLYHLGAMTWAIVKVGWMLQATVGTTACESMSAAANIFLGMTEAPLIVKPFLKDMTNSELHAVMTGGFATIAGTVMGVYISFGVSPSHLLSASFMSAPAALALAKLLHPETKVSRTTSNQIYKLTQTHTSKTSNFLDAASQGASQAVFLVANIIASLIAVTAFVALVDALLLWFGGLIGFHDFSFQWLLTKLFYPFAFIIGIDTEELEDVSYLLGLKTVVNEFVAYERLTAMPLSPRSTAIATYALCCFANFSSIGITLGGLSAIAPTRRRDMARTIWRAFIGGNFAALMTACVAGTLTDEMGYSDWVKLNTTSATQ